MISACLSRVRVVLVETSHPGNIGSVARAMKTMGLSRLSLVRPLRFPCAEATALAAGADDLLHTAGVHQTLDDAIADCVWVVGASAREHRRIGWPTLAPRECAQQLLHRVNAGVDVALVFGREHSGLRNEELDRCHVLLRIPTAPDFHSLNLAAAVQVIAWAVRERALEGAQSGNEQTNLATGQQEVPASMHDMAGFYAHLERMLVAVGYLDPANPRLLLRRLRRLFNRAAPDRGEINILRGILLAAEKGRHGGDRPLGE